MKLTFKGVDISTEEKFVSYINSLNTAIMKQNAMNEIKQDLYDVSYLKKRYRKMMTGVDGANLERMLIGHIDETKAVVEENARIKEENKRIAGLLQKALTRVGVVRFRAFEDMGSDLSYAVALLDAENNGVILSSIFGREDSRSYVKPIEAGTSTYTLTEEEEEALHKAMQAVGFNGFVEVALGGDMTAAYEADEWLEAYEAGEKKVTSCCPGFVNMVRKHYPELADKISTTVSPMCAVSRMIKAKDPDAVTVFIGPCVAKKSEVHDQKIEGNADYVLTFSEIRAIMKAKGVQLEADDTSYQEGSVFGKRFANSGGVTAAVIESMKEKGEDVDCKVCKANGAAECKKALLLMKAGKLPENFIEGMACEGGCVGGPSSYNDMVSTKKFRDDLLSRADDRKIRDNIANYHMETFEMHRKEQ